MPTYLGFLRAINLGRTRKFPKAAIVRAVEAAGGTGVATYINTGNVRFDTPMRSRQRIEAALERAFLAEAGFEVPTMVFSVPEFAAVVADAEELTRPDLERHYVYLLKAEPEPERVAAMVERSGGAVVVRGRAAHVLVSEGLPPGSVDPWGVERVLGVPATNRNLNVVRAVGRLWCEGRSGPVRS